MDFSPKSISSSVATCDDAAEASAGHNDEYALQKKSLPPIFRLLPEVLETIFILGADDYHSDIDRRFGDRRSQHLRPRWVNVSYVCRHWRNVALDCAVLWGYHFAISLRWSEELLARSKQAPLKIHIVFTHLVSSFRKKLMERLMCHADRIQELYLVDCNKEILASLSSHAPSLQNVNISVNGDYSDPLILFHGSTPALRTLRLLNCPVLWHSFKSSRLTTLDLQNVPNRFRQNIQEFLATLSCMPGLIHLYLDGALSSAAGHLSGGASHQVYLPHLSRLSIIERVSTVVTVLSCLDIPSRAEVRIGSLFWIPDDFLLLRSVPGQRFCMSQYQTLPSGPTIHSLVIEFDTRWPQKPMVILFSALERDSCDTRSEVWGSNIPLRITVHPSAWMKSRDRYRWLSDICCSMPLPDVHSLRVIDPPFSSMFWREILGHLWCTAH